MGPTNVWLLLHSAHKLLHRGLSLVPRPSPSYPSLAVHLTVLQATGSWARAWERGYRGLKPESLFPYFSSHWTGRSLNWPRRSPGQFMFILEFTESHYSSINNFWSRTLMNLIMHPLTNSSENTGLVQLLVGLLV